MIFNMKAAIYMVMTLQYMVMTLTQDSKHESCKIYGQDPNPWYLTCKLHDIWSISQLILVVHHGHIAHRSSALHLRKEAQFLSHMGNLYFGIPKLNFPSHKTKWLSLLCELKTQWYIHVGHQFTRKHEDIYYV